MRGLPGLTETFRVKVVLAKILSCLYEGRMLELTRGFGTLYDCAPGPDLVHDLLPICVPSGRQDEAKDLCSLLG